MSCFLYKINQSLSSKIKISYRISVLKKDKKNTDVFLCVNKIIWLVNKNLLTRIINTKCCMFLSLVRLALGNKALKGGGHRNGMAVKVTALVVTGDIEACSHTDNLSILVVVLQFFWQIIKCKGQGGSITDNDKKNLNLLMVMILWGREGVSNSENMVCVVLVIWLC